MFVYRTLLFALALTGAAAAAIAASPIDAAFQNEAHTAMDKMMSAMAVKPSGRVDADFVGMMVPHHQGAIDMARSELRYGKNEQLQRIAQEIIVDQQQEIAAMRLALGQQLPPSKASPDQLPPEPSRSSSMPRTMRMR